MLLTRLYLLTQVLTGEGGSTPTVGHNHENLN